MNQHHSLSHLPTEIHHLIFSYLDYVRDIFCDQLLFVPMIDMPSTLEEFEEKGFGEMEKFVDFEHPSVVPFFLACKSLTNSVKTFRPTQLNLTTFSEKKFCRYAIDNSYRELLNVYPWFEIDRSASCYVTYSEWVDKFVELFDKMKRVCKTNPLKNVEFISLSNISGRNYSSSTYAYLHDDFKKIISFTPSFKYLLCGFHSSRLPFIDSQVIIVNAVTTEYCYRSGLLRNNNKYSTSVDATEHHIEELRHAFPSNYPRNMEVFLFNSIISNNVKELNDIIDNFKINIKLFSYIWNVEADLQEIKLDILTDMLKALNIIYEKYPSFRVFRIRIESMVALKLIMTYPFVDINVGKNITKKFLESIELDDVQTLSSDYNIDLSKLGSYKFSAACFNNLSKLQIRKSCDIFGVSTEMITLQGVNDLNKKDKFGNNLLHYFYSTQTYFYSTQTSTDVLKHFSADELDIFGNEQNVFGVIPKEIAILNIFDTKVANFNKKFNFEGLVKMKNNIQYPKLLLIDGLTIDARILYAFKGFAHPKVYHYMDEDINYRDSNGKHLIHYFNNTQTVENCFNIPLQDLVFCKDNNQTIPIQHFNCTYHEIMGLLSRVDGIPKLNFISHSDDLGMYRFLYLLTDRFINTHLMVREAESIAFDYSSGQPELVSLSSYYTSGNYHFSIEKSPLKQLRNIKYFGTVDGDDFSHFVLRYYLSYIKENSYSYIDHSILKVLFARGLQLNVIRNSKGQTAFDLLDEFKGTPRMMGLINNLRKVCKRGLGSKSRAIPKFSIRYSNIPENLIVEKTETTLILATKEVSKFRIRIKRTLYFD